MPLIDEDVEKEIKRCLGQTAEPYSVIAKACGVSPSTVRRILLANFGERKRPVKD